MIAVIGGGAAGMAAAIEAAREGAQVMLLEKGERLGRKLSATGNGRCNLTNLNAAPEYYFTHDPELLRRVLRTSSPEDVIGFFLSLGLFVTEEEEGRIYPSCGLANAVVDVLRTGLEEEGVTVRTGQTVQRITRREDGYCLTLEGGEQCVVSSVIVACGSAAAKDLGGTRTGIDLLRTLGHGEYPLTPALSPLCCEEKDFRALKGIRAKCGLTASLTATGDVIRRERGELQFTEYGLSGIPALLASTQVALAQAEGIDVTLSVDFLPNMPKERWKPCSTSAESPLPAG